MDIKLEAFMLGMFLGAFIGVIVTTLLQEKKRR